MRPQVLLVFLAGSEEGTAMLKGIAQYERAHGPWAAFVDGLARAENDPRWLRRKKWSGVISRHTGPALVQACQERQIPLVDLNDTPPFPGVPKIRPDNAAIGRLGAEHFLARGFRHFAFAGDSRDPGACERRDGFLAAVHLAGHDGEVFDVEWPGERTPFGDDKPNEALAAWLDRLPRPVATMACHDQRALQVLGAAEIAGLIVPEEVAVLGANNDALRCDLSYPPLSSVATDAGQAGYRAAEILDRLMHGQPTDEMDVRLPPVGVVTRLSTDVRSIGDRDVATALGLIRAHACRGITVNEVVRRSAVSRSQLERRFRRCLGRSPQAEIRRIQLARIKQLLSETDFPLRKIAELTGFEHTEYICVLFKRLTGESPGSYRQKMRVQVSP